MNETLANLKEMTAEEMNERADYVDATYMDGLAVRMGDGSFWIWAGVAQMWLKK